MNLCCKRKGQINVDYLFGFFVMSFSIIYASNLALTSIGPFYDAVDTDNLHAEAWLFSESFLRLVEAKTYVLNETMITEFATNSTKLYDSIEPKFQEKQMIVIYQYPIVFTTGMLGNNHTGYDIFNKTDNPLLVNFTLRNSTFAVYDLADIEADVDSVGLEEDDSLLITGTNYIISKIDTYGNFIVLERIALSYGNKAIGRNVIAINRYSSLDGFIAKTNIMYY